MEAFQIGPFDYVPGKSRMLNGVAQTEWALCYGGKLVGSAWVAFLSCLCGSEPGCAATCPDEHLSELPMRQ